jgi:hypothetical protein
MKRLIIVTGIVFTTIIALLSFSFHTATTIIGRVNPVDGANSVTAISGKDTVAATITNGAFSMLAKPGIYRITIDAREPYKDVVLDNVGVKEDQTTDVGEIVLQR